MLGEHDELIGYHLEQAHESRRQLGPLDDHARSLGERAARLLASAAHAALDRDDLPAASSLSGRALDRLEPEHPERAEILLVRCEALLATGDVTAAAPAVTELAAGASSPRLRAWATCFSGELANLTDPARLRETEKHVLVAAAELAELGDAAGAAKAHTVRATALAGLGRGAECEGALDDALTAAREAGDRRRVTDVLGRAPTAALWGPSPVSRAGGRCLDIVRLLRITTGSPAVEATSLRCQAVLEAFRGRADAARRMLRKARRDLEELGLSHGIHETEMFAGIVELAAGDPAGAEPHLRSAHEGLLAMRVDVHAARAAALLARAHLAMGEEDDAERFADESERLGGDDLKTAIAWRAVRAQILARRGRIDEARQLAESAVEIASRTDALIDHGDACTALAAVCAAAGDAAGARRASEQAASLYERKGATALLETIQGVEAPAAQAAPASTPADGPVNECVLVGRRFAATFEKRDWTACASLLAPDVRIDDRRAVISYGLIEGREAALEIVKSMAEVGTVRCELTPIAIRGRSLVLGRVDLSGPVVGSTSFGAQILQVGEIDEAGLLRRMVNFDPDDFDAAIAELDERYAAGEGAEFAKFVTISSRFLRAINNADENAFRRLCSEDIVQIDHRPASLGEMRGLTTFVESVTALQELAPGLRILAQRFVALRADASVAMFLVTGKTPDGADFEQEFSAVAVLREGLLSRIERFPADDLDAALFRFNELDVEGRDALSTPCTRAIEEHLESFLDKDWAALGALLADDVLWVDKRAGLQNEVRGRAATVESYRAIAEVGVTKIERGVVATRGHKLSLSREVFGAEGVPYEAEMLALNQTDGDGRIVYRAVFDPADFDTAIEELDERFIAGEGAACADVIGLMSRVTRAISVGDKGFVELLADDFVEVDHRPASFGETHGRHAFGASVAAIQELMPGLRVFATTFVAARPTGALMSILTTGKTPDGAEIEQAWYGLATIDGNQNTRIERFALDDLEHALRRLEELCGSPVPRTGPPPNECWRAYAGLAPLFEAGDWVAFEARLAEDIVFQDHRMLTTDQGFGPAAITAVAKGIADTGILRLDHSLIATRGERLALVREYLRGRELGSAAFETEFLQVVETDQEGAVRALLVFDSDDFDEALAELDERYTAAEGAPYVDVFTALVSRLTRSYSKADWFEFRSTLTDDIAFVDNRPASLGRIDNADGVVRAVRELKELVPDLIMYVSAIRRVVPELTLVEVVTSGTTPEGASVELVFFGVVETRDSVISRIEIFPSDQLDAALSRFDELERAEPRRLENACVRAFLDVVRTFEHRDWDRLAECYTPDTVFEDRRRGLRDREIGREARLRVWQGIAEVGVARISLEPLAIRGERLALGRSVFSADDSSAGFETELLVLYEIDGDGRTCSSAAFDGDGLDAAFAELDERYAAGEAIGSEVAPAVADLLAAMNARDWSKLRSILSDSLTVVDHRPASLGELGPDQWIDSYKVLVDLLPDVRAETKAYRAIEGDRSITEHQLWSLSEGALVENRLFALHHVANGKFVHFEFFPIDRFDLALARFEELGGSALPASAPLENAAVRAQAVYAEAVLKADWDGYVRVVSEDSVWDDRRSGLQSVLRGRDARLEHARATSAIGVRRGISTPLAIRGDRLLLSRVVLTSDEAVSFEAELLMLTEVDAAGKICASVAFGADDGDAAFAELDERYVAGEGAPYAETLKFRKFIAAYNARDWDGMRAAATSDFHVIDHRPASFGLAEDVDEMIKIFRTLIDLVPDIRIDPTEIHAIDHDTMLASLRVWGTSTEGADIELSNVTISRMRDGLVSYAEIFPSEQLDAALARFDELTAARTDGLQNGCSRTFEQVLRLFEERRWDDLGELYSEEFVVEDRRPGLGNAAQGRTGSVEGWQAAASVGAVRARGSVLATRGERLALTRVHFSGVDDSPDAFTSELVFLNELDKEDRIVFALLFDPDDIDAAFVELDERYIAGEGAPYAELWRGMADSLKAHAERDLENFAIVTEDFVYIDHSPSRFGRIEGRDAFLRQHKSLLEIIPDARLRIIAIEAIDTDLCLWEERISGTNTEGGDVEIRSYVVGRLRDGCAALLEEFPLDQRDAALARFEELRTGAPPRQDSLENAASRTADAYGRAFESHDWAAMEQLLSEDSVWDDRRRGLQSIIQGRAARMENVRAISSVGALHFSYTPVAVRGERLALERAVVTGPEDSDFYVEQLMVVEVDESGRASATVVFDPDDANAFAELEERYMRGEGAAHADVLRAGLPMLRALNARDWDGFRSLLADDLVFVDHRPASLGEVRGADRRVQELRTLLELLADYQVDVTRFHALAAAAALGAVIIRGTTTDGAQVEIAYHMLYALRGDLVARMEVWPMEDLGGALAKFDEFPESDSPDAGSLDNTALRVLRTANDLMEREDWEGFAQQHAENVRLVDGRRGLQSEVQGRQGVVDFNRTTSEVARYRVGIEPLAVRGDRLALARLIVTPPDGRQGFEVELLNVSEVNAEGLAIYSRQFDADDIDAAFAELDDRYIAGEGAPIAEMVRATGRVPRAVIAQDWPAFRDVLTEDFVLVDHRPASMGELGSDEWIESWKAFADLVPDLRTRVAAYHAVAPDCCVAEVVSGGTSREGGSVETVIFGVIQIRGDRVSRLEAFPVDRKEDALARFGELSVSRPAAQSLLGNRCTRTVARIIEGFEQRDWEIVADCHSDDTIEDDRRTGFRTLLRGRDEVIGNIRAIADVGTHRIDHTVVATRGETLALFRFVFRGRDEAPATFGIEALLVFAVDVNGRVSVMVMFDPDDLDAAFAELEERYLAGEGSAHSHAWGVFVSLAEAYGRDWEMYASLLTDDLIFIDHRPASLGRMDGPQELIRSQKALIELVPDMRWRVESIEALERDGFAVRMHAPGTSAEGAQVEFDLYFVGKVREGRLELLEFFPVDQRDAALARFEELAHERPDHPRTLENAVTRMAVRYAAAFESQNWATMEQLLTEESVWDDRRPGFQSVVRGRDIRIENVRAMASVGALHFSYTPMATRGDRLALLRAVVSGPADSEFKVETVMVAEVDEQGRASVTVVFEREDLDGAFAELDDRYLLLEDAERSSSWRVVASAIRAFNARDWDAWSASASDDFVYVDHCPANMGRIESRDAAVRMDQALIDVIPDLKIRIGAIEAITDDCCLVRGNSSGTNSGGGPIELASYAVIYVHDGKVKRMEEYPIDQIDAAWARFRELCSTGAEPRPLENLASRAVVLSAEAILRADWDAYAALQSPDFRGQDRRSALRMEYGWKERIENARAILAVGVTHIESECLAVRGERLALVRSTYSDAERTLEVQVVGVIEVDDEERFVFGSVLDPDNLDAAFDELDERYIASLEDPQVARISAQFAKAFNSRDWDGMRLLMGADFVYVDHQPAGVGTVEGFDVYVHTVSTLLDLVPDLRIALTEIFAMSDCGVAYRLHEHGTDDNGNAIQFEYAGVGVTNDGRITRIENFPIEELDAALARFEELATPS